jgi:predicted kinase
MPTIVITRGLPASGKTTWALAWLAEDPEKRARANRDDLRAAMFGATGVLDRAREDLVTEAQRAIVRGALRGGRDVVVDDTNLRARYARAWVDLAVAEGADWRVQDFTDVPVDECIARDAARAARGERAVGGDVIGTMNTKFLNGRALPDVAAPTPDGPADGIYVPDLALPPAWIVDVDGTLADNTARHPFAWDLVHQDTLIEPVAELVRSLAARAELVVMSGRDEVCRDATHAWLVAHRIPASVLLMRTTGDYRPDATVKRELFDRHVAPRWNVRGVVDDRRAVVHMWRSMGLMCAQVALGNF